MYIASHIYTFFAFFFFLLEDNFQSKSTEMKKKKKQSRSLNPYSMEAQELPVDSSSSPKFLSLFRSKLSGGRELKLMFRNLGRKKASNGTPQARLVRCPKCQKILQEPEDVPLYRCGRCDTVLQAKSRKSEEEVAQISKNSVREAILLSSEESEDTGSVVSGGKSSGKKTDHLYDAAASSSGARSYVSETAYKHEKSDVCKEWLRRDKTDMLNSGRTSPFSVRSSVASGDLIQQKQHETRPRIPFYPASPSPSSAYEYECSSPFHASYVSAPEKTYYNQQNHFKQYERGGWSGETSGYVSGETMDARYYQWSRQSSPIHDFQYHGFLGQSFYDYSSSCTATPHRSAQSERSCSAWSSKIELYNQKGAFRNINGYVKERIPVVYRHVLPAAGGAPFVTCYYCLQLLQLSQEFLHGKKKRYLVRCGGCSGVLKFSLKEKVHTVPSTPTVLDSRPIHAEDNVSNHQEDQDLASVDHEESSPHEGPLSCLNKDCGDSLCQSSLNNDGELVSPCTFQGVAVNNDKQNISEESSDAMQEMQFRQISFANEKQRLSGNPKSGESSGIHLEQSEDAHSEHSRNEYENSDDGYTLDNTIDNRVRSDLEESGYDRSENLDEGKKTIDRPDVSMEDKGYKYETTKEAEITEDRLVSHRMEPEYENESTCETLEPTEKAREMPKFDCEKSRKEDYNMEEMQKGDWGTSLGEGIYGGDRTGGENMGDRPGLHLEEYESNYEYLQGLLSKESEWKAGAERVPTFRFDESELGKVFEPGEAFEDMIYLRGSLDDHKVSNEALESDGYAKERALPDLEFLEEGESETELIKPVKTWEIESKDVTETVELMTEVSKLCLGEQLEQEQEMLAETLDHFDLPQYTLENLKQTLESNGAEEDRSACSSRLCTDDQESSSETIKLHGETAKRTPGDNSESLQDEEDKMGLTFEPFDHIWSTMDPSEIVGLRHALYTTQSSPIRSPLTSPIHTPVGSPRGYLMASPLHPHIVSPLRSPINSSPSLSDVLFFGKNC